MILYLLHSEIIFVLQYVSSLVREWFVQCHFLVTGIFKLVSWMSISYSELITLVQWPPRMHCFEIVRKMGLLSILFLLQLFFFFSIFDIYFRSPIVEYVESLENKLMTSTKRLVLFVGDGLPAEYLYEFSSGYSKAPFLRYEWICPMIQYHFLSDIFVLSL